MRGGIFCYRKEAPKIVDFLYFSLRKAVRMRYDDSIKLIVDLTAGSGCLAELVLRALSIKGSEATSHLLLLDKEPRPIATTMLGIWLTKALPRLHGIRIHFEPIDDKEEHVKLAESLNAWVRSLESKEPLGLHADIMSTSSLVYDLTFIRHALSEGRLQVKIVPAEDFVEDLVRKNSNLGRLPITRILDPPWAKASKNYYGSDRSFVPKVMNRLYERKAVPLVYVDRLDAWEILNPKRRRVIGYYRLYQQGKTGHSYATYMWVLTPESSFGEILTHRYSSVDAFPHPDEVQEYEDKRLVFDFEDDRYYALFKNASKKHKVHVRELFGVQDRRKPIVEKLPERDFMKPHKSSLEDFLGGLL